MKVGDLVKCRIVASGGLNGRATTHVWRTGVITSFDADDDPVVCYYDMHSKTEEFHRTDVEVISESR